MTKKLKVISYNVNGIRAAMKKGFSDWLKTEKPDILCMQETKAQPEQIDAQAFAELGYYSYVHSAKKKGYSGVAILTKQIPDKIVVGMGMDKYDDEGRVIRADYGDLSVISVYFPSGSSGDARQDFKMEFLKDFQEFIDNLRLERPNLLVCGDYNICHKAIDIHSPEKQQKLSGFLPEEREWLDGYELSGMVDSFRQFNKEGDNYSWWSYRTAARERNLGWRIDYIWATSVLESKLQHASILSDAFHSDHCPVMAELAFDF